MKFSENWLREFVNPDITTETLLAQLNQLGLEVDGIEPAAPSFSGVIVAEIEALEQHPDADKLRVCTVNTGSEKVQIVCGAPNVETGGKYPLAVIGAVLPTADNKGFKIKKAKLRGVESQGMLCSEKELGLSDASAGLMPLASDAPVGTDLRDYLQLNDNIIEIDITPNRSDCFCLRGVARDVAALNNLSITQVEITPAKADIQDSLPVQISAPDVCGNYAGRIIKGVNVKAETPLWMKEKLRRSGIRSLGPSVDVTNYVMLELGQPMHAFDLAKLDSAINVRMANQDEALTLLDDSEQKLDANTLVIADKSQALAIAGVMGGLASSVTDATQDLFLESAYFKPTPMAGVARRYGLHTESSLRFERGVDPELQIAAIERATALLLEIVGGKAGPITHTQTSEENIAPITLRCSRIERLLGFAIPDQQIETLLKGLQLGVTVKEDGVWQITVPSYRFDIRREADLIEELVRLYGYENIPERPSQMNAIAQKHSETKRPISEIKNLLHAQNYNEVITYSFISKEMQQMTDPQQAAVNVSNPISAELGVMRTNLLGGLLNTLKYHLSRDQKNVKIYEIGLRYVPQASEIKQEKVIAGLCFGEQIQPQWHAEKQAVDFYSVKGELEQILGNSAEFLAVSDNDIMHPGQTAEVVLNGKQVGILGQIHPNLEKALNLPNAAYYFELSLAPLIEKSLPTYSALSRFQQNRRDIAIEIEKDISWNEIDNVIQNANIAILQQAQLFDVYTGKNIRKDRKSYAIGLILQEFSRTLTDEECDDAVEQVVSVLHEKLGAELRN